MKIIKRGSLGPKFPMRMTCDRCSTIFEADRTDFKPEGDPRDQGAPDHVVCPYCDHWVYPKGNS